MRERNIMGNRLSVCIVAYQNYDKLVDAIESLEKYTNKAIKKKIYIVDNSDKDVDNKDFLKFLFQYDDVVYIRNEENIGFGKAHNRIICEIDSDYHAIVNPDIIVDEDVFTPIIEYMETEPQVGMVVPRIVDPKGTLQKAYRKDPTVFDMFVRMFCKAFFKKRVGEHTLQGKDYKKPFQVPFAQGCFLVIRTELFRSLKGFDDRYFMYMEDADLCRRVNKESRVMYYPEASVIHAWEKGSHKSLKLFRIHLTSMVAYFKKWGWKFF